MRRLRKENWLLPSKKKSTNEIHLIGPRWEQQTTSLIAFIFGMLINTGKKIINNAGINVDLSWEILTVVMMSYYENVLSCKIHTVVCCTFSSWRFTLIFLGLTTHYRDFWYNRIPRRELNKSWTPYNHLWTTC